MQPRGEGGLCASRWKAVLTELFQSGPRCRCRWPPNPDRDARRPWPLYFRCRVCLRDFDLPECFHRGTCSVPLETQEQAVNSAWEIGGGEVP